MPLVGILRVERVSDSAGVFRRIAIEIDGERAARVGHGKTDELPVKPGQHSIRAKLDWHASPILTVDVPAGEPVTVRVEYPFSSVAQAFKRSDIAIRIRQL